MSKSIVLVAEMDDLEAEAEIFTGLMGERGWRRLPGGTDLSGVFVRDFDGDLAPEAVEAAIKADLNEAYMMAAWFNMKVVYVDTTSIEAHSLVSNRLARH